MRIDQYLVVQQYFPSRNQAQEAIKNNNVLVNQQPVKASYIIQEEDVIEVINVTHDVSRSASKLREAVSVFNLDFSEKVVLDIGQGSGGFTQVALEQGARHVIGLDVGHSQLHDVLRSNPNVSVYEGVNVKEIASLALPAIDLVVCDISFISSLSVLSFITTVGSEFVLLLKPQFETQGKHLHNGVIHQAAVLQEVIAKAKQHIKAAGLCFIDIHPCSQKGKTGNQEYMVWFKRC